MFIDDHCQPTSCCRSIALPSQVVYHLWAPFSCGNPSHQNETNDIVSPQTPSSGDNQSSSICVFASFPFIVAVCHSPSPVWLLVRDCQKDFVGLHSDKAHKLEKSVGAENAYTQKASLAHCIDLCWKLEPAAMNLSDQDLSTDVCMFISYAVLKASVYHRPFKHATCLSDVDHNGDNKVAKLHRWCWRVCVCMCILLLLLGHELQLRLLQTLTNSRLVRKGGKDLFFLF